MAARSAGDFAPRHKEEMQRLKGNIMEFLECFIRTDTPGSEQWASMVVAASAIISMKRPVREGGNWRIGYANPGAASPEYVDASDQEVRRFLRANALKGAPVVPALPGTKVGDVEIGHWVVQADDEIAGGISAVSDLSPVPYLVEIADVDAVEVSADHGRAAQEEGAPQSVRSDVSESVDAALAVRATANKRAVNDW